MHDRFRNISVWRQWKLHHYGRQDQKLKHEPETGIHFAPQDFSAGYPPERTGAGIRFGSEEFPVRYPAGLPVPECPEGETFCSNLSNYPRDMVENMVAGLNNEVYDFAEQLPLPEPKTRFREPEREESAACATKTRAYYPQVARNLKNDLSWIVNDVNVNGMMLRQRVDTVICVREKKPCNSLLQTPESFTTECRQGYQQIKMLSISRTKQQKVVDTFTFPSHCECFVVPLPGLFGKNLNRTRIETTETTTVIDDEEPVTDSNIMWRFS